MKKMATLLPGVIFLLLCISSLAQADYLYTGTNLYQSLAVLEPAAPDSLFRTWTGDLDKVQAFALGISSDSIHYRDTTNNWDILLAVTGSWKVSSGTAVGLTIPYIVRDSKFNDSDLLDLRGYVRAGLIAGDGGGGLSGELNFILPTASKGESHPLTLDSPVAGVRFALFSAPGTWRFGANFGYQQYLASESGEDSDMLYGAWLVRKLDRKFSVVAEISGSSHDHSGPPGDDTVSDDYALAGLVYGLGDGTDLAVAAASGLGDSAGDIRVALKATTTWGRRSGGTDKPAVAVDKPELVTGTDDVIVVVLKNSGNRKARKKVLKALEDRNYRVGLTEREGLKIMQGNVLYYAGDLVEKAIRLSRLLVFGGTLESLDLKENTALAPGEMVIVLGGK
jgi:hypothetical protein